MWHFCGLWLAEWSRAFCWGLTKVQAYLLQWPNGQPRQSNIILKCIYISRVSCQKGPIYHALTWRVGPVWQDSIDIWWFWLAEWSRNSCGKSTITHVNLLWLSNGKTRQWHICNICHSRDNICIAFYTFQTILNTHFELLRDPHWSDKYAIYLTPAPYLSF